MGGAELDLRVDVCACLILTSPRWGVGLNPHRLQMFFLHWVHWLWLGSSTFSSTWHSGQVSHTLGAWGAERSSSRSTDMVLGGFLDLAVGVSGAESESGGDPGGENGESGGEPAPESRGDPGPESTGESGGDSSALLASPVTILVAELRREDPKVNIWEAAAGGLEDSARPEKPPNSFPATDSSCLGAAGALLPNPPKSFPVTESAA